MPAGYRGKWEGLQFSRSRDLSIFIMGILLGQAKLRWQKRRRTKVDFLEVAFTVSKLALLSFVFQAAKPQAYYRFHAFEEASRNFMIKEHVLTDPVAQGRRPPLIWISQKCRYLKLLVLPVLDILKNAANSKLISYSINIC